MAVVGPVEAQHRGGPRVHEDAARDVTQEAFVKVFGKLDAWRGESTIGAWIKQIVVREAIDALRKRKVQWSELPKDLAVAPEAASHADEEALQADAAQALQALQSLPDGYRAVLTLYLVEGYDHAEIAEILGIELSTSLSQFHRGRKKLQQMLTHLHYHG